uniref:Zinc finger protein 286A n=1 Tax=Pipistrellus kuhlii TaxID=59472 RepID=A0A7J7S6J1_PIPKU|nr:zinc finger protein 286A [Pipistrellus kuhlii]
MDLTWELQPLLSREGKIWLLRNSPSSLLLAPLPPPQRHLDSHLRRTESGRAPGPSGNRSSRLERLASLAPIPSSRMRGCEGAPEVGSLCPARMGGTVPGGRNRHLRVGLRDLAPGSECQHPGTEEEAGLDRVAACQQRPAGRPGEDGFSL